MSKFTTLMLCLSCLLTGALAATLHFERHKFKVDVTVSCPEATATPHNEPVLPESLRKFNRDDWSSGAHG